MNKGERPVEAAPWSGHSSSVSEGREGLVGGQEGDEHRLFKERGQLARKQNSGA